MNAALRRLLLPLLRTVKAGKPPSFRNRSAAEQAIFLIQKQRAPTARKKPARQQKIAKAATHREETARIREAVFRRAGEYCECGCGRRFNDGYLSQSSELDHWLGGSGRRRQKQAVENTWALTGICHFQRTRHVPSARFWNARFEKHCAKYGYPFVPHIEHQSLPAPAAPGLNPPEAVGAAGAAEKEEG